MEYIEQFVLNFYLELIEEEMETLKSYIEHELHKALEFSWTPTVYERTGDTMKSIVVIQKPKIEKNYIVASIGFDDTYALHDSVMGKHQPKGYTPFLLEFGWDISDKTGKTRAMFDVHPGYQYIKKAVERYNKGNRYGITISVYTNDKKYI
jgi:hypothetical protein